ncbi:MAG: sensor histidine kinase [Enterococcus sp.]
MIKKLKEHELFTKLLLIFVVVLFIQAIIISLFIYYRSKDAYIELFDKSNETAMNKIQHDFETLNDTIENTLTQLAQSAAVEAYFKKNDQTPLERINELRTIQKLNDSLAPISPDIRNDIFLFGENGRMFISNDMISDFTSETFFEQEFIDKLHKNPASTQMIFTTFGLTKRDKDSPSILFIKKLQTTFNQTYGYAVVAITSQELSKLFTQSVNSEITQIDFVTEEKRIFASNEEQRVGTLYPTFDAISKNQTQIKENRRVAHLPLYRQNSALVSEIDVLSLTNQMGMILPIIIFNSVMMILVGCVVFIYLNRHTKSIYQLIDALKQIGKEPQTTTVPIHGTSEIRTLGTTINHLLTTIDDHHNRLLQNEQRKRALEIKAMQAQIQPHFIYNTLTSIKFLVWQQKNNEAILGIESFIDLLRSTIGNKKEIIPVSEEIKSVESYIAILTLRYGDNISTKLMIPEELSVLYMPSMIIQPIIENAYLHAFQKKTSGFITVYATVKEEIFVLEVIDTGDGFDTSQTKKEKDYFSGIGIENVQERIQLLYGEPFGLSIQSIIGIGTTVIISLPVLSKTKQKDEIAEEKNEDVI